MRTVIRFRRSLRVDVIPGDGVFLLSERAGQTRLHGALIELMAPLLDGRRNRAQIVAELAAEFPAERVDRVLDRLLEAGHLIEVDAGTEPRAGAFWETAGLDGDTATRAVLDRTLAVRAVGGARAEWFTEAARSLTLTDGPDAALTVVVTDDYLRPELADINAEALRTGQAWMPVKPVGTRLWAGPVFEPGQTGCWQCLASRLSGHQLVDAYLRRHGVSPVTAVADLPVTVRLGVHLAELEAAKWLAGHPAGAHVLTFDTLTLQTERHLLLKRPQCQVCGVPELQAARHRTPVRFSSRPAQNLTGGRRAISAERFVATHSHLVSPITGPVSELKKLDGHGLHVYASGQNFALPLNAIGDLRVGLRSRSAGKGTTDAQAKAGALGEAVERYSGLFQGDEARITDTYRGLGEIAISPERLQLYSERQYAEREEWNRHGSPFSRVSDPLDESARIDWTPVWSLTQQRHRYLPTGSLFYGHRCRYAFADSNGCAAGSSLEDAALQGFLELVERDSVAIWWYNRLSRPEIDLTAFDDPYFQAWTKTYEALGRECWVLDLTTDLEVPAVAAISRRIDGPAEEILLAFGSHFDLRIAVTRALTEMNQMLPHVTAPRPLGDADQLRWWATATLENQPYLRPVGRTGPPVAEWTGTDLHDDLLLAQQLVEKQGLEMLVLDQTRVDVGLPVVKVIVPGLRSFWPRYAQGRLYDVPVSAGWLPSPVGEADLNPVGMFL
jgi:oxazoline/thiazoline synthase